MLKLINFQIFATESTKHFSTVEGKQMKERCLAAATDIKNNEIKI
jgi:hypothetical protein